jgi:o-succinylbenzoate synthase
MKASYQRFILNFKREAKTSRGTLIQKKTYLFLIQKENQIGYGECAVFRGLSIDDVPNYEQKMAWVCHHINIGKEKLLAQLIDFPSIQFGLEQAFLSLNASNPFELFPSKFTESKDQILINGLIWMGTPSYVKQQIEDRIKEGFTTIKMKISALNFQSELSIIESIRKKYSAKEITLRLDANGAFTPEMAIQKLDELAKFDIHSVEQPIKQHQHNEMEKLCRNSPIPIALDEELIGVFKKQEKQQLLEKIKPQYLILKPSLLGGIKGCNEWIELAEKLQIDWWITSSLESNLGLNALAQWTYTLQKNATHGLGTGSLFTNNFSCPLKIKDGILCVKKDVKWQKSEFDEFFKI